MGAGRNKSHRKKRISKHVLDSVERKKLANVEAGLLAAAAEAAGGGGTSLPAGASVGVEATETTTTTGGGKESSSRRERKLKDPAEASTYLSSWKYDRADINTGTTTKRWKFNKNTQSWLLRHMYDGDRVNKTTFAILLEYIIAGKCDGVRSKVREDAKVRARRYKEWETTTTTEKGMKSTLAPKKKEDEGASSSRRPISSGGVEAKRSGGLGGVAIAATSTTANDEWKTMDEHEKRREYKRARKVLDTLKTKNEGGIE